MTQQEIFLNLKKNGKDNVLQTIDNCIFALEHDGNLRGTIRFNVLTERDCIVGDVGWERTGSAITERDMSYLKLYFERHYHLNHEKALRDAIRIVANENRYHPIRDYLNGLQWDGTERIAHVLHHFLGAAEDEYTCEAMKIFLLGAIKRVFQPGCKFETMLCLVGGQGCGSPVATSKCCRHFEAPTEPTGETQESPLSSGCWQSRMNGSRMTCGGWTTTTCTESCKVTGSSKCRR